MTCEICGYETWPNAARWTLKLPIKAVSQNELQGNYRGASGWRYRGIRRRFETAVARGRGAIPAATGFRRAIITRHYRRGRRAFDYANLVGGCKPLIDALSKEKLLVDDSPKWCSTYFMQEPSGTTKDYITIVLEERGE